MDVRKTVLLEVRVERKVRKYCHYLLHMNFVYTMLVFTAMKKYMQLALSKKCQKWSPKCAKDQTDQSALLADYIMVRDLSEVHIVCYWPLVTHGVCVFFSENLMGF